MMLRKIELSEPRDLRPFFDSKLELWLDGVSEPNLAALDDFFSSQYQMKQEWNADSPIDITITEYEASHGKEIFIAAEDSKEDVLFGYCRLRFPSQFLREEITEDSAIIRELHVYSAAVQIGKKSDSSFQHRGIGKSLMAKAEEITKQNGKNKMIVISGIGAREYFRKLGYGLEGAYMTKMLN